MNYEQILKEHVKKEIFITFEMLMHHGNHSIWQFLKHSSKCEESLTNTKMVTSKMRICRGISIHSFYRSLSRTNKWFKAFLSYLGHNVLHLTIQYSNIFSGTITSLKFYCNKYKSFQHCLLLHFGYFSFLVGVCKMQDIIKCVFSHKQNGWDMEN